MKIDLWRAGLFCSLALCAFADTPSLPVYRAVEAPEAEYFSDKNGNGVVFRPGASIEFLSGCSWYCGGDVDKVSASSELAPNGSLTYGAAHAHDFNPDTAWVEGAEGDGVGERLTYEFFFDDPAYTGTLGITRILVANGYKKSPELWQANGRVKQFTMYKNGAAIASIELLDTYGLQTIEIEPIMFPAGERTTITFEIADVYPGTKYHDTAVSLLMFDGIGAH